MRNFALLLLLTSVPLSWGQDDTPYPVDLTCEVGANVFYLHLTGDKQTSWVAPVFVASLQNIFDKKHLSKKHYGVRSSAESDNIMFIQLPINRAFGAFFDMQLNRYNLKLSLGPRGVEGHCSFGFKKFSTKLL